MKRTLLALCAVALMAGLGLGAGPAAAYVGEYSFAGRGEERAAPARAERRVTRPGRATREGRSTRRATRTTSRAPTRTRSARVARAVATPSLTGGSVYQSGIASYYWQGQRVASGGWFNPNGMTAAHRTLPFGTRVRVTNQNNGRSVVVRINDRGPFIRGRIIDLSRGAAQVVGMTGAGLARVTVAVLGR